MNNFILHYLLFVNLLAFVLFGLDKYRARKSRRRISENTLLAFAVAGGSVGALIGIKLWRHKTKHAKFYIGVPAMLLLQLMLFAGLCFY